MNINENLKKMAEYNPTKQTFQMTTLELCKKIESSEITLPLYQRDVSWTLKKSVELFNYQLNGKAPVSPISVNKITTLNKEYVTQINFINREIIKDVIPGQLTITDGQQRLTTNFKAYLNHIDFKNVVLDINQGDFNIINSDIKTYQIPVGILLNKSDDVFYDYVYENEILIKKEVQSILVKIRSKLRDYNYTINLAENLNENEQVEWFEVLNNAGSRVSRIQMSFSKLKLEGLDIYTDFTRIYVEKVLDFGLKFYVKTTEVSRPVATLNCAYEVITEKEHSLNFAPFPSDTNEKQICSLDVVQIKEAFKMTLEGLDRALKFISDNKLFKSKNLDYISYLTGYFVFLGSENELSPSKQEKLIKWYKNIDFSNKPNTEKREIFDELLGNYL